VGLLKKKKKKKGSAPRFSGGGGSGSEISPLRPQYVEKLAPCAGECPSDNDVRGWLTAIALREKTGLSLEEATDQAWMIEVETNPFPGVMGRVCPHPCESACNRQHKDGAVSINSVERQIGDWGIKRDLKLPFIDEAGSRDEKIAIVGAGPSGMSCAYQLARRGYKVTVFDAFDKPGGMLRYGIPSYRLPREILDAEIKRIVDMGVELKSNTSIDEEITLDDLRKDYDAVFVGIGAHRGKTMGIPGEEGSGVFTGTEFLNRANSGEDPGLGEKVVVVGGGDTAIDAARVSLRLGPDAAAVSRRLGAEVKILYRRTRQEMPAIEREIEEALEEGIDIEFLAAPAKINRDGDGKIAKIAIQRFELGEPDDSGRRRPVPIEGDVYEMEADTVIMAVSQAPDWSTLGGGIEIKGNWLEVDEWGRTTLEGVWSGGDTLSLGLATISIGQGRRAAECIHATLRGEEPKNSETRSIVEKDKILLNWYPEKPRAERKVLEPEERLGRPMDEMDLGITAEQTLEEVTRCFSCGSCFGCENCWMYCQANCFKKAKPVSNGHFYTIDLKTCDGCKKCAEECPCGYIDLY
jgi:NADPH-dependent glutamate synthase beta subunit-like oxidoreductase/Pyruvate/2-oxoacid:ferredoxin oxidoreductase delta subunit